MSSDWNAAHYETRHHYVTDYGSSVVKLLDPKPGERVLDLGCGTGRLTREIADSGAEVAGIDSSPDMIARARKNYPELRFELADALTFQPEEPFDAVFSNAVLHWVKPPEGAVKTIARALKPGGRMVVEFGGKGNTQSIVEAIGSHPWYYPSIGEYASLLEANGLQVVSAVLFPRPTRVDGESGCGTGSGCSVPVSCRRNALQA